jgi:hypothetical protein
MLASFWPMRRAPFFYELWASENKHSPQKVGSHGLRGRGRSIRTRAGGRSPPLPVSHSRPRPRRPSSSWPPRKSLRLRCPTQNPYLSMFHSVAPVAGAVVRLRSAVSDETLRGTKFHGRLYLQWHGTSTACVRATPTISCILFSPSPAVPWLYLLIVSCSLWACGAAFVAISLSTSLPTKLYRVFYRPLNIPIPSAAL